jgi:hypothetical protein
MNTRQRRQRTYFPVLEALESRVVLDFSLENSYPVGPLPLGIAAGFFGTLPNLDIVTANAGNNTLSILRGNGDRTFSGPQFLQVGGRFPDAVALGNFNTSSDNFLDIAVANRDSNNVTVFLSNPDGSFRLRGIFPAGNLPVAIAMGDTRGIGTTDLIVANADGHVSVLWGNGDGTFQLPRQTAVGPRPTALAVGQFKPGSILDVAVTTSDDQLHVLVGDGSGFFSPTDAKRTGHSPAGVVATDLDNDGLADLAVVNRGDDTGSVTTYFNNGDGTFQEPNEYPVGRGADAIVSGKFNMSHDPAFPDLVTANGLDDNISLLVNQDNGTFADGGTAALGGTRPSALAVIKSYMRSRQDSGPDGPLEPWADIVVARLNADKPIPPPGGADIMHNECPPGNGNGQRPSAAAIIINQAKPEPSHVLEPISKKANLEDAFDRWFEQLSAQVAQGQNHRAVGRPFSDSEMTGASSLAKSIAAEFLPLEIRELRLFPLA